MDSVVNDLSKGLQRVTAQDFVQIAKAFALEYLRLYGPRGNGARLFGDPRTSEAFKAQAVSDLRVTTALKMQRMDPQCKLKPIEGADEFLVSYLYRCLDANQVLDPSEAAYKFVSDNFSTILSNVTQLGINWDEEHRKLKAELQTLKQQLNQG